MVTIKNTVLKFLKSKVFRNTLFTLVILGSVLSPVLPSANIAYAADGDTYYWVGVSNGTGNWSDVNCWSNVSGGAGGAFGTVPNTTNPVKLDINSVNTTGAAIYVNTSTAYCASFSTAGVLNNPTIYFSSSQQIITGGSVVIDAVNITSDSTGGITFNSAGAVTLTTNGLTIACRITTSTTHTGTLSLSDSFNGTKAIVINRGTFTTNNHNIIAATFASLETRVRALNLGSSLIEVDTWNTSGTNITINSGTSKIIADSFNGGGYGYYDVQINGDSTITGNNTGNSLSINGTSDQELSFTDGTKQSFNNFTNDSTTGLKVLKGTGSTGWTISDLNGGANTLSNLYLFNSTAENATFTANHSLDGGGNSGWVINEANNTYYVSQTNTNGYAIGNDANDGLTKAQPKLTVTGALLYAIHGEQIIINDGDYAESLSITRGVQITPETSYSANITSNTTVIDVDIEYDYSLELDELILDGQNLANQGINFSGGNAYLSINGTRIQGVVANSILANDTCSDAAVNITDVEIYQTNNATYSIYFLKCVTGYIYINSGVIELYSPSNAPVAVYIYGGNANNLDVDISGLNIETDINDISANGAITIYRVDDAVISNNDISIIGSGVFDCILVGGDTTHTSDNVSIHHNTVYSDVTGGHLIMVGTESSDPLSIYYNKANDAQIYNNTCNGTATGHGVMHGIMVGGQRDAVVYNNTVYDTHYGYLAKGDTNSIFYNNIADKIHKGASIYAKSATGTNLINNTVVLLGYDDDEGIRIDNDSINSTGIVVTNNIIYSNNSGKYIVSSVNNTGIFNNNLYYSPTNTANWTYLGVVYASISGWQLAVENSAISENASFINYTASDYDIKYDSGAINSGDIVTITSDYDSRPTIGIKDIGAFEYQPGTLISTAASGITMNAAGVTGGLYNGEVLTLGSDGNIEVIIEYGATIAYGSNTTGQVLNAIGLFSEAIPINQIPGNTYHWMPVVNKFDTVSFGADGTYTYTMPTFTKTGESYSTVNYDVTNMGAASTSYGVVGWGYADGDYSNENLSNIAGIGAGSVTAIGFNPTKTVFARVGVRNGSITSWSPATFVIGTASSNTVWGWYKLIIPLLVIAGLWIGFSKDASGLVLLSIVITGVILFAIVNLMSS
jgi:hypothetical protein